MMQREPGARWQRIARQWHVWREGYGRKTCSCPPVLAYKKDPPPTFHGWPCHNLSSLSKREHTSMKGRISPSTFRMSNR